MVIYEGYKITQRGSGYVWTDERGFVHYYDGMTHIPFATVEAAKQSIDAVMRAMAPHRP